MTASVVCMTFLGGSLRPKPTWLKWLKILLAVPDVGLGADVGEGGVVGGVSVVSVTGSSNMDLNLGLKGCLLMLEAPKLDEKVVVSMKPLGRGVTVA